MNANIQYYGGTTEITLSPDGSGPDEFHGVSGVQMQNVVFTLESPSGILTLEGDEENWVYTAGVLLSASDSKDVIVPTNKLWRRYYLFGPKDRFSWGWYRLKQTTPTKITFSPKSWRLVEPLTK